MERNELLLITNKNYLRMTKSLLTLFAMIIAIGIMTAFSFGGDYVIEKNLAALMDEDPPIIPCIAGGGLCLLDVQIYEESVGPDGEIVNTLVTKTASLDGYHGIQQ